MSNQEYQEYTWCIDILTPFQDISNLVEIRARPRQLQSQQRILHKVIANWPHTKEQGHSEEPYKLIPHRVKFPFLFLILLHSFHQDEEALLASCTNCLMSSLLEGEVVKRFQNLPHSLLRPSHCNSTILNKLNPRLCKCLFICFQEQTSKVQVPWPPNLLHALVRVQKC